MIRFGITVAFSSFFGIICITDTNMASDRDQLTLQECAARLHAEVHLGGPAPSLITLKRWSAAGLLDKAKAVPAGSVRAKYQYARVRNLVKAKIQRNRRSQAAGKRAASGKSAARGAEPSRVDDADQDHEPNETSQLIKVDLEQLTSVVTAELSKITQTALAVSRQQIMDGLANLDATRKMLMQRYDAEFHLLRSRVEELTAENKRLRAEAGDLDGARIVSSLNHIRNNVATLVAKLESR